MPSNEEIIARHGAGIQDSKIWFTPNIPAKKLQGAIHAYAQTVYPDDVLMLVDNTIWGGCGDGMLITRDRLYAHDYGKSGKVVGIAEIRTVNVTGAFAAVLSYAAKLFINGNKFVTLNCIEIWPGRRYNQSNHVKICRLVTELASGFITPGSTATVFSSFGMVSEAQECPGCGAVVRGLAVCSYCSRRL